MQPDTRLRLYRTSTRASTTLCSTIQPATVARFYMLQPRRACTSAIHAELKGCMTHRAQISKTDRRCCLYETRPANRSDKSRYDRLRIDAIVRPSLSPSTSIASNGRATCFIGALARYSFSKFFRGASHVENVTVPTNHESFESIRCVRAKSTIIPTIERSKLSDRGLKSGYFGL